MSKRILILDDDKGMCEEIAEILEDEGYYVNMAVGWSEGKKLIIKPFDIERMIGKIRELLTENR